MFRDPASLAADLDTLEEIERASLRLVTQALVDFRKEAVKIYAEEHDYQADIGEDITREALDLMGVSRIPQRLFGKIDYKRARYVFHPGYAIRQALFVDSKAEKSVNVARIQVSQTSMRIRQRRAGVERDEEGKLPKVYPAGSEALLTTTIFVKYFYQDTAEGNTLKMIRTACIPNGMLQERYNPTADDTIWKVGPDSPRRREEFRTRLSFSLLKKKATWRVQDIKISPEEGFRWSE